MFGGSTRDVQVPNVTGQAENDAIATLQNAGFKTTTQRNPDSTVPPNHVINTNPGANSSVGAGDEITLNVSTGPEQREVVDCKSLAYAECVQKLSQAGFGKFKRSESPSTPELKDKVLATIPPANQTSAITNEITIVVGTGPESKPVPDVKNQQVDSAQQVLTASGFTKSVVVDVDSPSPKGQVVVTVPAAGEIVALDTVIQVHVSKGNQFIMPDVRGGFWTDVEPNLRNAYGWTGPLIRGPDVQNSGQRTNAVVTQTPAAGTPVRFDDPITLSFAS
jgi:eukaryotic-like serine/threonine-protein kinase